MPLLKATSLTLICCARQCHVVRRVVDIHWNSFRDVVLASPLAPPARLCRVWPRPWRLPDEVPPPTGSVESAPALASFLDRASMFSQFSPQQAAIVVLDSAVNRLVGFIASEEDVDRILIPFLDLVHDPERLAPDASVFQHHLQFCLPCGRAGGSCECGLGTIREPIFGQVSPRRHDPAGRGLVE
ncbi:hypothetical protein AMAG_19234 [Allomyces macrogynus ATCC 38327]|uniref:Uncharacterized protein n=1 Tax=Allomyces macrogynus (strain ATCC 38327) TaxID=578462 RepID=A0A0L0STM6_ALLM3|nr:hypothetical protein AMAG_19234 [Allomyces macrogynus ATCC 38327]|eukprot:KNE65893.1 hypothetical protein AMAG_19234 [Allomyces macrogynus ATCC 38327]